jgi:hypothetical protein
VLIGSAIEAANGMMGLRKPALDPGRVLGMYAAHQLIHLLPSIDFEQQKAWRKGTQAAEAIDYFSSNFHV